ncbi:DUF2157 domain-containing protein [Granulicella sibirica]|uniref:Membrane protein n=1 Tax=Granulicella sibirica TaxID=2479048 RepID=A0A4Q0T5R8_9BACT|nr:DUF2157 domain-containing protein [Granulicella sibirica]RXH57970.1 Membrane protein [Granulicella sibirica]
METPESLLTRWQAAGLIDDPTAARIRAYESAHARPANRQWQVLLALILGCILLSAGVLLFVAAHWDALSPTSRLTLVLSMLAFFHGIGLLVHQRFPGLATAMHAVGTVSCGAAIALIGQIFNMQEHWPAAILLWALCAAAGWLLLRDQFQQTLTLLLIPAWIACEWADGAQNYTVANTYLARAGLVLAIVYLAAFLRSRRRAVFGILFAAGAILAPVSIGFLAEEAWRNNSFLSQTGFLPVSGQILAAALILAVIACGWLADRRSAPPAAIAAALAYALPWAQAVQNGGTLAHPWTTSEPNLLAYALVAASAVFLVWWGVHILSPALVNYGIVAFALTVAWFYFSSVMDKLNRSLGLIVLGVLFLAGGWALEQTRRRLVNAMSISATPEVNP